MVKSILVVFSILILFFYPTSLSGQKSAQEKQSLKTDSAKQNSFFSLKEYFPEFLVKHNLTFSLPSEYTVPDSIGSITGLSKSVRLDPLYEIYSKNGNVKIYLMFLPYSKKG